MRDTWVSSNKHPANSLSPERAVLLGHFFIKLPVLGVMYVAYAVGFVCGGLWLWEETEIDPALVFYNRKRLTRMR